MLHDPGLHLHEQTFTALAKQNGEGEALAGRIASFYAAPISVAVTELRNGQHRVCAMRRQGALEAVIST